MIVPSTCEWPHLLAQAELTFISWDGPLMSVMYINIAKRDAVDAGDRSVSICLGLIGLSSLHYQARSWISRLCIDLALDARPGLGRSL